MIPNHSVIVSVTEPKGKNRKKVWFRKSKNLFNIANAKPEWIGCTGNTGSSDATNRTDKIEIKANTDYVFSYEYKTLAGTGNRDICIYDKNLKVLTKANSKVYNPADKQVSIKSSVDGYVDISYDKNCTNIMFERNNKPSSYEIYVEPQLFVRNSNGVYEEFINKKELEKEIFVNKTPFTANEGYTIDLQYMNKQGKHYWGTVVFHKNSGMFGSSEIALKCNVELAQIFSYGCFLGTNTYNALAVGYLHLRANQELYVGDNNNTSKYNYARCFVDFIEK